jgi:hypothetical protein
MPLAPMLKLVGGDGLWSPVMWERPCAVISAAPAGANVLVPLVRWLAPPANFQCASGTFHRFVVPKLNLGTPLSPKLRFVLTSDFFFPNF